MDIRGLRYIVSSTTRVASRVARQQVLRTSNRRLYSTSRLRTWRLHGAKDIRSFLPAVEKSCTEPAMHKMEPELQKRITNESDKQGIGKKYFIETLGCQMNVSDSEIVATVLNEQGFLQVKHWKEADIVLLNTCAIRENAEEKAIQRLRAYKSTKQARRAVSQIERNQQQNRVVGVLGCMAERLKEKLLDETKVADLVVGPDAYRDLPNLLKIVTSGPEGEDSENFQKAINVELSYVETYADIRPVRSDENGVKAYVSIMRGCNNMCSYCIVPFTRGRERSRDPNSILSEIKELSQQGFKEVTLLGQNVNSYFFKPRSQTEDDSLVGSPVTTDDFLAHGFRNMFDSKSRKGAGIRFHNLLEQIALVDPELRIRFTSPHPKDFTDEVIDVIAKHSNVCKGIHLPAQSGSSRMLENMRRYHTKEAYMDLVTRMRKQIPDVELSSDFIVGFCGETEADHRETIRLLEDVTYAQAFMFAYSERERTHAHRSDSLQDDVPEEVKARRLHELVAAYRTSAARLAMSQVGKYHLVLVESTSRRNDKMFFGRTDGLRTAVFPKFHENSEHILQLPFVTDAGMLKMFYQKNEAEQSMMMESSDLPLPPSKEVHLGDYVLVRVEEANQATLRSVPLAITTLSTMSKLDQNMYPQCNKLHPLDLQSHSMLGSNMTSAHSA